MGKTFLTVNSSSLTFGYGFQVKDALPSLRWLLDMQDDEVLADACWALSRLSEGSTLKIQAVIDAGICPKLVELLS
jgi:hypothetical protein